ncbi:hypothetical protein Tco_0682290 [Tanacetum coccineum]|uniref:Uncharacterized protein n=1 Tax=Tanacetum coccineum TaxID=301880 RepID=A0ABQ4XQR6_9ASTR
MVAEVLQSLEYRCGQLDVAPMLDWSKKTIRTMTVDERKAANLDQRLKSLILPVLPDDQINSDFQDSPDDEEDIRSNEEYIKDLKEEYQERALLAKSKRFFKKGSQRFSSAKATDDTICHNVKEKKKGLVVEAYEWDEEDVSSDDNEMTEVKVLMALADDESVDVGKESARNKEWVKDHYEKVLKQAKLDFLTMQYVNTKILKENKNIRKELKELTAITKKWLNNSNKVNQCISEQIPSQKKRILGLDQLPEDPSSSRQTDLVFVNSLTEDTKVSIPGVERP